MCLRCHWLLRRLCRWWMAGCEWQKVVISFGDLFGSPTRVSHVGREDLFKTLVSLRASRNSVELSSTLPPNGSLISFRTSSS